MIVLLHFFQPGQAEPLLPGYSQSKILLYQGDKQALMPDDT